MPVLARTLSLVKRVFQSLTSVSSMHSTWLSWWSPIMEPSSGAWQMNVTVDPPVNLLAFSAVYACTTGIASDIAKMRIKLSRNVDGIWTEVTENQPWLTLLQKPNHYQTRAKFIEQWMVSKLLWGNAYILKQRDQRGVVNALYVLNPQRVRVLQADDGSVFYQLMRDPLSQITIENFDSDNPTVPASEIIHDMMVSLWHPLIGVPPIYACGISATMGLRIQANSTNVFTNMSRPGGVLTAPGKISDEVAVRLKTAFETNYGGANVGKVAVLGDGLKFEAMVMPAEQNQLIEQLKWTVEDVARSYHYPMFKLGGPMPTYNSIEALTVLYYTDCLQPFITAIEDLMDDGILKQPNDLHFEFDLDDLIRMDTATLYESNNKAVAGGWMKPNEARFKANFADVEGGDTPYLQQQNYSLAALAKRDAQADPFATKPTTPAPAAETEEPMMEEPEMEESESRSFDIEDLAYLEAEFRKELALT